ncbi:hypothetical protein IGI04_040676, partial [Brassica rapa subsp. trilocularis]
TLNPTHDASVPSSFGMVPLCWDCEIPCPTLSYLISTILSTLGLIGKPAWIYFWFLSQKASASFENVSPTTSRSFEIVITDLRQPGALIPIVGIAKSRVQLYLILLVRYCPLWA